MILNNRNRTRHVVILLAAVVGIAAQISAAASGEDAPEPIVFGVVPQQSASLLAKKWMPVLASLSSEIGMPVRFVTTTSIPIFERCLTIGAYDLAYMNPLHYIHFHAASGYQAIAHESGVKLQGILVARRDAGINGLTELEGVELAFPSPAAFGASILTRAELRKNNIAINPKYVGSHDSVYRAVAGGFLKAGGGITRTFELTPEHVRSQLEVIYTTAPYTPHAIAHRKGYPKAIVDKIRTGLVALGERSPEALATLGVKGFQMATNRDWDDVRSLKMLAEEFDTRQVDHLKCR